MKPESTRKVDAELRMSSLDAAAGESKEDREKSFSRRALLLWSLPAVAMGLAALSTSEAEAYTDHSDDQHTDSHDDWHGDSQYADSTPFHTDNAYQDMHEDHDDHGDHADGSHEDWTGSHGAHLDSPHTDVPYEDTGHEDHTDWGHGDSYVDHDYIDHDDHGDTHEDYYDGSHVDSPEDVGGIPAIWTTITRTVRLS